MKEEDQHWEAEEKASNHVSIFFHVHVTNKALEGRKIGRHPCLHCKTFYLFQKFNTTEKLPAQIQNLSYMWAISFV